MDKPICLFVVGTRPDAIKSAPVVIEFQKYPDKVETVLVSTGQHTDMLDQVLDTFGLVPDEKIAAMNHGQSLASLTAKILNGMDACISERKPDMVFAQGDTTTTFVAGLASFYHQVPFAHIEAGLRTDTVWDPFPEEFNRRAVSEFAALHFAPTSDARDNLLNEGAKAGDVFVTGNTGIDAVQNVSSRHACDWFPEHSGRIVLLTTHRRENWGEPQTRIAEAAAEIVNRNSDVLLVVPMHKNPAVRETLSRVLEGLERVTMIEPPDYPDFVKLMQRSDLILTDSGGVQEEAPSFGKPVLVLRETTERPEGVAAGTALLIGTDKSKIIDKTCTLLTYADEYNKMAQAVSPYGDGKASARIRSVVFNRLDISESLEPMWL